MKPKSLKIIASFGLGIFLLIFPAIAYAVVGASCVADGEPSDAKCADIKGSECIYMGVTQGYRCSVGVDTSGSTSITSCCVGKAAGIVLQCIPITANFNCSLHDDATQGITYTLSSSACTAISDCAKAQAAAKSEQYTPTESSTFVPIEPTLQIDIPTVTFSKITQAGQVIGLPFLAEYISGVYKYAVAIGSIIAIVLIMVGGLQWMMAGGSSGAITAAKNRITGAVIGLILLLGSYTLLYTINPNLISLNSLKVKLITRETVEYTEVISDTNYATAAKTAGSSDADYGITGTSRPSKEQVLAATKKIAQEVGITDTCMYIAIVTKESGGDPGRVGHVSNYQGPVYVTDRMKFLMSGKTFKGKTFTPPFTTEAEYKADPAKYNALSIKNDDVFNINSPPNYGLDWRYAHDFGLGQYSLKQPSSDIPKLLTVSYNLKKTANLFKSNLECAGKKYSGKDMLPAAYFAYAAGCGAMAKVKDKQTFYSNRASTRAMSHYQQCKASITPSKAEPDPMLSKE